jgi:hypothetical protein
MRNDTKEFLIKGKKWLRLAEYHGNVNGKEYFRIYTKGSYNFIDGDGKFLFNVKIRELGKFVHGFALIKFDDYALVEGKNIGSSTCNFIDFNFHIISKEWFDLGYNFRKNKNGIKAKVVRKDNILGRNVYNWIDVNGKLSKEKWVDEDKKYYKTEKDSEADYWRRKYHNLVNRLIGDDLY